MTIDQIDILAGQPLKPATLERVIADLAESGISIRRSSADPAGGFRAEVQMATGGSPARIYIESGPVPDRFRERIKRYSLEPSWQPYSSALLGSENMVTITLDEFGAVADVTELARRITQAIGGRAFADVEEIT